MKLETQLKSLAEWKEADPNAYAAALKQGLIEKICEATGWAKRTRLTRKPWGYWTLELCIIEGLKYSSSNEWKKNSKNSYNVAGENGWLEQCTAHMERRNGYSYKVKGFWSLEKCKVEALKYKTLGDWRKSAGGSYNAASRNGWLDECSTHMEKRKEQKPNGYWVLETCKVEALKYSTKGKWQDNSVSSYAAALNNGWLEECCKHMIEIKKPKGFWTIDKCKEEALKYTSITEWFKNNGTSYNTARENGWLDECCKHMEKKVWTIEMCMVEALKYSSRTEWQSTDRTSYGVAYNNGWLDECCKHIEKKPRGFWTIDRCKEEALKYSSRTEWQSTDRASYRIAYKNGWLDDIKPTLRKNQR